MKAEATIKLKISPQKRSETVLKALIPEVKKPVTLRSQVEIGKDNKKLQLKIKAKDTVALRAAFNAHLRWISNVLAVYATVNSLMPSKEQDR